MLEQPLNFTGCSSIQFFNSPPFPKHIQLGHTWYPQKVHFQDYSFKKLILRKNTFSKLLPQKKKKKKKCSEKKYISKNHIFKIVFSKNIKLISLIYSSSESS